MNSEIVMGMEARVTEPPGTPALGVGFYVAPRQSKRKSKAAGHPVFEDTEFIRIVVIGDKNGEVNRPASQKDKTDFPRSYMAFKEREGGKRTAVDGMPLEEWAQVTRSMALTLKAANIFTVEGLATVADGHIDKLGPNGRELRAKAQGFVAQAKDAAAAQTFKAENDRLVALLQDQQRQIAELAARLDDKPKRGPGRPRKQPEQPAAA